MFSHSIMVPLATSTPSEHRSLERSACQVLPLSQWHTGRVLNYSLNTVHRLSQFPRPQLQHLGKGTVVETNSQVLKQSEATRVQ